MSESSSPTEAETLGPGASRVYETSAGLLHAAFAPASLLLASVPSDGWLPMFGRGRDIARSAPALVNALRRLGLPDEEAEELAHRVLVDWEAIEIPEPRSRRQQLTDVLGVAALGLRLLAHTPRFAWEVIREREGDLDTSEPQTDYVRPGSSEYGVIRLVKTSRGWVEFEFWAGPPVLVGAHRDDGWLPLSRHCPLEQRDVIEALRSSGLPQDEAERVGNLVLAERQARLADSS